MTKERPILFNGEMVRAILEGRKTQTRRVVKGYDIEGPNAPNGMIMDVRKAGIWVGAFGARDGSGNFTMHCPYGVKGDRLWVRETFVLESSEEAGAYPLPFDDGRPHLDVKNDDGEYWLQPHYRATDPEPELAYPDSEEPLCRWKPSIFMPRWASRINLEVTAVRVERVQDIGEEDAIAEGVGYGFQMNRGWPDYLHIKNGICELTQDSAVMSFSTLWDSINGKPHKDGVDISWKVNPWVWVVFFKKIEGK